MDNDQLNTDDSVRGDVFMIDRIKKADSDKYNIEFKKVYVSINKDKI